MLSKGIVTTVVSRNGHDGTCSVASQHIVAYPDRNSITGKRIDGVRAGEDAGYLTVGDTLTLRTFLCGGEIILNSLLLLGRSNL